MKRKKSLGIAIGVLGSLEIGLNLLLANLPVEIRQGLISNLGLPYSYFWLVSSFLPIVVFLPVAKKLAFSRKKKFYSATVAQEPIVPDNFISRGAVAKKLHKYLKKKKVMLIGGEKGLGKSLFAMECYKICKKKYDNSYWVGVGGDFEKSFLSFGFEKFLKKSDLNLSETNQMELIFSKISSQGERVFLVVDNVNEVEDLKKCLNWITNCENLFVLITTQILNFPDAHYFNLIKPSSRHFIKFFKKYCPQGFSKKLLKEVIENLGKNLFLVKFLAKNLEKKREVNPDYRLQDLVGDLDNVLQNISKRKKNTFKYNGSIGVLQVAKPEYLVVAMYELFPLQDIEKKLLSALLPLCRENVVSKLLNQSYADAEKSLKVLAEKGYIEPDEKRELIFVSSIVQDAIKFLQKHRIYDDSKPMIEKISQLLSKNDIWKEESGEYGQLLLRYAFFVLEDLGKNEKEIAMLNGALGNYHKNVGDIASALPTYGKACLIFEELCKGSTANHDLKYNLSVSYYKLGSIHKELGSKNKALKCFEHNTKLAKELYNGYPQNISLKSGLASSLESLGQVHHELANFDKAKRCFQNCLKLTKDICEESPEDVLFKKKLIRSYENLGNLHKLQKQLDQALSYYENGVRHALSLSKISEKDVSVKKKLVELFSKLGSVHLANGRVEMALKCFARENSFHRQMHKLSPKEMYWKEKLATSCGKMGSMYDRLGLPKKAMQCFLDEVSLFRELCKSFPKDVSLENGLALAYAKLATFYFHKRKDVKNAKKYYEKAKSLWGSLSGQFPQNKKFSKFLSNVKKDLQRVGKVAAKKQK